MYFSVRNFISKNIIRKHNFSLYYVESRFNDSDCLTRPNLRVNHALNPTYWNGLFFLQDEDTWPIKEYQYNPTDLEFIRNPLMSIQAFTTKITIDPHDVIDHLCLRFNNYIKVLKTLTFIFFVELQ